MHLISSRLFSKWAGTFFSIGLRALARSHEIRWVGPLTLDERLNHKITNIFRKETSQYALPTSPTRSDKPYPTPPRSANAPETNAPSLTPDCVYEEM